MKTHEQAQARNLRSCSGLSVKAIAAQLKVSKGSVSRWVRNIKLSTMQLQALENNKTINAYRGAKAGQEKARVRNLGNREQGYKRAEIDDSFRVICALYWGEGTKNGRARLANSDHRMISVMTRWLVDNDFEFSVVISAYLNNGLSAMDIHKWWTDAVPQLSNSLSVKVKECQISRASQRKNIGKLPYGTLTIDIKKSVAVLNNFLGGIEYIASLGS